MKIYLAGDMKSGWQDKVKEKLPEYEYLDPRDHSDITHILAYTELDLNMIQKCDIIFCYMESSNPGGYNFCLEAGYGFGLGKKIIYVNEDDHPRQKYFGMLYAISIKFNSIDQAIMYLKVYRKQGA